MKIAIVTDLPRSAFLPSEEGLMEDRQKRNTVKSIKEVLSERFTCVDLVFDENILNKLKREKVDLVFNLCNGIRGSSRISQLPAMLEFVGIPYTGSSPLGHALAYNKIYSCKLFNEANINTPKFAYVSDLDEIEHIDINLPAIVKPKDEGSSRGIHQSSLVFNKEELIKKVRECLNSYDPPVMITEYIDGREFTVGLLGNGENISVLPIVEIDFSNLPKHLHKFYSFEVKIHYGEKTIYHIPAKLDKDTQQKIEEIAIKAFKVLDLRDYARVDIRLKDGQPYVLEVNSLPGLMKGHSDITKMAEACGLGYKGLIFSIVENAMKRYNLDYELEFVK